MANMSAKNKIERSSPNKKKGGKKGLITVVAILFVITLIVVIIVLNTQNQAKEVNRVVSSDNVEEVMGALEDNQVTPGNYEVKMNTSWTFENGSSTSKDAFVENSTANTNDVFFTIVRNDTSEEILRSPVIPVGSRIEDIKLDKLLPAGSYDCVITYHLVDDSGKELSSVNLTMDIKVKE